MFKKILISLILGLILYFPAYATDYTGFHTVTEGKVIYLWLGLQPNGLTYLSTEVLITGVTSYPKRNNPVMLRSYTDYPSLSNTYSYTPTYGYSGSCYDVTTSTPHTIGDSSYWNSLNSEHIYAVRLSRSEPATLEGSYSRYWGIGLSYGRTPYSTYGTLKYAVDEGGVGYGLELSGTAITSTFAPPVVCLNDNCTYEFDPGLPEPTGSVTSQSIDNVNREITISGEGNFDATGEGYTARLDLFKQCGDSSDFEVQSHVVATITWYADDDVTTTQLVHNDYNRYIGAGYTDTDSTYEFSGVTVPYDDGLNCTYPAVVRIWDANGEIVYNSLDVQQNPDLVVTNWLGIPIDLISDDDVLDSSLIEFIPENSTTHIDYSPPTVTEDENIGIIASIILAFKNMFINFFKSLFASGNFSQIVPYVYEDFKSSLSYRVPFGYVMTAFDTNLNAPAVSDEIPVMTIDLTDSYGLGYYEIDFPEAFDNIINSVRSIFSIVLYMLLFYYFIHIARGLF